MEKLDEFFEMLKKMEVVTLATTSEGKVSMRMVSPVVVDGKMLFFTSPESRKYRQLRDNPNCCIGAGSYFAEATAEFCGSTMADENAALRDAYCAKFSDAFDEGVPFGGRADDFVLLTPTRLSGWAFATDHPENEEYPTIPFEVEL